MIRKSTEIRREQIIDEAIKIIHKQAFSALSIRELAKQVQLSEAALYRHFTGKDDILDGIFIRISDSFKSIFEKLNAIGDIEMKLEGFIRFHLDLFESKPEFVSIMFSDEIFASDSSITKNLIEMMRNRHNYLKDILDTGMTSGLFRKMDSDVIATMIQGYIRLTMIKWKRSGYKFSLTGQGTIFIDTLKQIMIIESTVTQKI